MDFFGRAEAARAEVAADPSAVRKHARWVSRGAHYMRGYGGRSGQWINVDPSVQRMILGRIEAAAPAVAAAFNAHLLPVGQKAQDEWPVKTGLSAASIGIEFEKVGATTLIGRLVVRAPYAYFVNAGADAKRLILNPGEAIAEAMARDIGEDLD